MVGEICVGLLRAGGGRIDAVDGYCRMVPATLVGDYFGLIGIDKKSLMQWSYWAQVDTFYNQPFDVISAQDRQNIVNSHNAAADELAKYIKGLILKRLLMVKLGAP